MPAWRRSGPSSETDLRRRAPQSLSVLGGADLGHPVDQLVILRAGLPSYASAMRPHLSPGGTSSGLSPASTASSSLRRPGTRRGPGKGDITACAGLSRSRRQVDFTQVHDVDGVTVICEYQARLHRADLGGSFYRRYVSVITLRGGQIAHLREYGGPLIPLSSNLPS